MASDTATMSRFNFSRALKGKKTYTDTCSLHIVQKRPNNKSWIDNRQFERRIYNIPLILLTLK